MCPTDLGRTTLESGSGGTHAIPTQLSKLKSSTCLKVCGPPPRMRGHWRSAGCPRLPRLGLKREGQTSARLKGSVSAFLEVGLWSKYNWEPNMWSCIPRSNVESSQSRRLGRLGPLAGSRSITIFASATIDSGLRLCRKLRGESRCIL